VPGLGTQHEALWVLEAGYPLSVTSRRGNWLKVKDFEGDVGWVYRPMTAKRPHVVVKVEVANRPIDDRLVNGPGSPNGRANLHIDVADAAARLARACAP
jgi:SH3-like domain-containing protein